MSSYTRREFIVTAGIASAAGALGQPETVAKAASPAHPLLEASAASFRLSFSPGRGLEDLRLIHVPSGLCLAQGEYSYTLVLPNSSLLRRLKVLVVSKPSRFAAQWKPWEYPRVPYSPREAG